MKVTVAARQFKVPVTTLYDHTKGCVCKIGAGAPTVLTPAEEKEIVMSLQVLQEIGFGLTKELAGIVISDYLRDQPDQPNPFSHGLPGKDWWKGFLDRWQKFLSVRKPQHLSTHRAASATPEVFDAWFKRVEDVLLKAGLSELFIDELKHRIWNCDETGFCTSVAAMKVLAKRGDKDVHDTLGGSGREYITVLGAGCADGTRLPPYVIYKGKNLWSRWMQGGPAGCMFSVSDSGWMESANFNQWFEKMFVPATAHLTKSLPVILFFDGHISLSLIKLARDNNVHLICFPPHCTHILQPLDVSVFGPLKSAWRKVLKEHQIASCAATVTKEDFPALLAKLWEVSFLSKHLISGFEKCGLCPLSRAAIPSHKLSKAAPHATEPDKEKPQEPSQQPPVQDTSQHSGDGEDQEFEVRLDGECTVNNAVTPIRLYLKGYFTKVLQQNKQAKSRKVDKRRVKPRFYGEALTTDDVYERVLAEEAAKKEEAEKKKKATEEKKRAAAKRKEEAAKRKKAKKSGKA